MFEQELEKAREAAIILDESVLLRSSRNALHFYAAHSFLPVYCFVYRTRLLWQNSRYPMWNGRTYVVESCAVWEVLYLNAKAPPLLPSSEERPLSDADTIVDAIQRTFPALNRRMFLTNAAKNVLNSHYESATETERDGQKTKSGIIRRIDGVLCFDPDFKVTRLVDYGPQSDAQT